MPMIRRCTSFRSQFPRCRQCYGSVVALDSFFMIALLFVNLPNFSMTEADAIRIVFLESDDCFVLFDSLCMQLPLAE